ncbi:LysR family transcriptional regulator [Salipiger sp. P9]|uniref:LysR family transcriptional regulator n=1 Tax=Salipiger pentaromativorans TaxID=2943193 RepID=UPI002157A9FA|nr:LysR family transcriptional regulator [Salipiger pentaromativorans]MCR8547292.1 LysR family transcriptional regulator [Salipiger pentaromativorans]
MDRLNWDDVRLFLALAREGTLSGAARQLGLGVATMSRRIERMEQVMQSPLFLRHQQGVDLTDQGAALLPRAEAVELSMLALRQDAAAEAEIRGMVRLASIESLISPVVLPALAPLLAQNPGLDIEVRYGPGPVNLHRHDADLALRMIAPDSGNLTVRRVATVGFGLYGPPDAPRPTRGVTWPDTETFDLLRTWTRAMLPDAAGQLMLNTLEAQVAAVRDGLGIGILPHFLARRAGLHLLAAALPDGSLMERPVLLVTHADLAASRRIQAVAEAITRQLREMRQELIEG